MRLKTSMADDPVLAMATIIGFTMSDYLHQKEFAFAHNAEIVDLAVVACGLGIARSHVKFVETSRPFWDSSKWMILPRSVLVERSLGYVTAMAAWVRDEKKPTWIRELPPSIQGLTQKSLKYLNKTNDSFFNAQTAGSNLLTQSQTDWLALANGSSVSSKLVSLKFLQNEDPSAKETENALLDCLASGDDEVVLHAIDSVGGLKLTTPTVMDELRRLVDHKTDKIQSAALVVLTGLQQLDDETIGRSSKMVESRVPYVEFAGINALASLDSIPESALRPVVRGLLRKLQTCEYELIPYYVSGVNRWEDDPVAFFKDFLAEEDPGYLEITLEALENLGEQFVSLN